MTVRNGLDVNAFLGLDNLTDEARLPIVNGRSWLKIANNIDLDDEYMPHRRMGYSLVLSGDIHSFWSNGSVALFMQGGILKSMSTAYVASTVLSGLDANAVMHYVDVNGKIYFTNAVVIGSYESGTASLLSDPGQQFKVTMRPGQLIEYFKSRLYVAQDNILWFSDAVNVGSLDMRKNFFQFSGRITMVNAVEDGLYVSAGDTTYFLFGKDPFEFVNIEIAGSAAIEGSAHKITSERVGERGMGSAIMWASEEGVFLGRPTGSVSNKTWNHYTCDDVQFGSAIVRDDNGFEQYLLAYAIEFDMSGGDVNIPPLQTSGWME